MLRTGDDYRASLRDAGIVVRGAKHETAAADAHQAFALDLVHRAAGLSEAVRGPGKA